METTRRATRWLGSPRRGEEKKMERTRAREEKVEQMMSPRRAKVESLRGRLRREEGTWRIGEGTGGLGLLSKSQTEETAEGARG